MNFLFQPFFLLLIVLFTAFNDTNGQKVPSEGFFGLNTSVPGYGIKKMKYTAIFQGHKKKRNYFEGWYFKMVSNDGESILSIIPGISLSEKGDEKHAFIQIINGKSHQTYYKHFPIEKFQFSNKRFAIRIGDNYFCEDSIKLDIQDGSLNLSGKVFMTNQVDLSPEREKNKKIMGFFRFLPFMQCYHGVVSLTHNLKGSLTLNNCTHDFAKGLGYIEKDWGRSMPSAWIWMQSNSFQKNNTSFMLSIANIPWMGTHFTGFLGFFLHENEVHQFGTYKRTTLKIDSITNELIKITLKNRKHTYHITAKQQGSGSLAAPINGSMDRRIVEGIEAKISLIVRDKKDIIIFNDSTSIAGLEVVGNTQILKK